MLSKLLKGTVMMSSLGIPSRPLRFPPSLAHLNFHHHAILCTLKTNVLAETSSSAASSTHMTDSLRMHGRQLLPPILFSKGVQGVSPPGGQIVGLCWLMAR